MSRVLVIAPHPDDEATGCGGTLRQHVLDGDSVHVVFLTSGEQGGHGRSPEETLMLREEEGRASAQILGIAQVEFWREPDGALRATSQLVHRLRGRMEDGEPDMLYVTHSREMHPDHRAAARTVRRALSGAKTLAFRPLVRMYEVWTPLQEMDDIVDISPNVETKVAAIRAHKSQVDVLRFDDACLGLNRYRGEMHSWPGGDYAEIFLRMNL